MNRLFLAAWFGLFGQLAHISAQSTPLVIQAPVLNNLQPGQVVDVPITVKNFTKIKGLQFPVQWDPAVLKYQNVNSFNLPGVTIDNFGLMDTLAGVIRFNWYTAPAAGLTKSDGVHLFKIKMKVVGAVNSSTQISFPTNILTFPVEVIQWNPVDSMDYEIPSTLVPGTAAVGFTVGVSEGSFSNNPTAIEVFPNPFISSIKISPKEPFGIRNCRVSVRDLAGRLLFDKLETELPPAGMEIDLRGVADGTYFLIINSDHETSARKLVKAD